MRSEEIANIELVIKIPEELISEIDDENYQSTISWYDTTLYCAIKNGTPRETVTEFADRCKECEREKVLDKIRDEIADLEDGISSYHNDRPWVFKDEVLQIVDKYRTESEE